MGDFICFLIYAVLAVVWISLLLIGSRKHGEMIAPHEGNKYVVKELYPVGMEILSVIGYSYDTMFDKKRKAQAKIVYGERFGEYYYRINVAEKVTYLSIGVMFAPLLGVALGNPLLSLFGLFAGGIGFYYADSKIADVMKEREAVITRDFPDMVAKMALLINAGMITREAWEDIAYTGEGVLYDEMKTTVVDIRNGASEVDAYISFGNRCGVQFVKKFISMLVQNLSKGNKELVDFLKSESSLCWEEKKHFVRRQGEAAANKLMIPLGLILIGIFVMILVPIVSKMGI